MKLKKERTAQLKLDQNRLEYVKADQEKAARVKGHIRALQKQRQEKETRLAEYDIAVEQLQADLRDKEDTKTRLAQIVMERASLQLQYDSKKADVERLRKTLKLYHGAAVFFRGLDKFRVG